MSEELAKAYNAVVFLFDTGVGQWTKKGICRVSLFEDPLAMRFRIVARSAIDPSNIYINSCIFPGMAIREEQAVFVQWSDKRFLYGIKFDKTSQAKEFAACVNAYIERLTVVPDNDASELVKVEKDPKYEHVQYVLEIMLSDYNRFFGHFGQTYDTLECVPPRLRSAIEYLEANLHTRYLLGAKLDYSQVQRAEELFNATTDPPMDSEDLSVVGEYLKIFYKSKAPLMVMDNYEPVKSFIAIGDDVEAQSDYIYNLINSLPDENRQLLQVLIWLLANVAWNTEQNSMSIDIVSGMFAPVIMQPASLEYAKPEKVKLKAKLVF